MRLERIREGSTELLVPPSFCRKGPGKHTGEVFYNRQMEFGRDVSVMLTRGTFDAKDRVLDGLAATGARGVRMANEGRSGASFLLNDRSQEAVDIITRNVELNGLVGDVDVSCMDLRSLLAEERFSYIDIDPFGTPVEFIDSAVQSCRNRGVVAVTATDTAPLCGTYPRTSSRRYGARAYRSDYCHETGLRILIGYLAREAAKHDRGCVPLLCYSADHYFRCHVRIDKGARKADHALSQLGYAVHDPATLERRIIKGSPQEGAVYAGPLWVGDIHDRDTLASLKPTDDLGTSRRLEKMTALWRGEVGAPPLHYLVDELARATKHSPPKMSILIDTLRGAGSEATPTHFDPKGFKTGLPFNDVVRLYIEASERGGSRGS